MEQEKNTQFLIFIEIIIHQGQNALVSLHYILFGEQKTLSCFFFKSIPLRLLLCYTLLIGLQFHQREIHLILLDAQLVLFAKE
jgi:hypothetical protein